MPRWEKKVPLLEHEMLQNLYPQGMMIHQKGRELFKKPNWNENLGEAQKLKKEEPPLCQKIGKKKGKKKEGKKERKMEQRKKEKEERRKKEGRKSSKKKDEMK